MTWPRGRSQRSRVEPAAGGKCDRRERREVAVSLTTKQNGQANGFSTQAAQEWARQASQYLRARQLATQAQLAPLAANARIAAQQGMLGARAWTAPRLDTVGQALQEQMAPQLAAALSAAAGLVRRRPPHRARQAPPAPLAGACCWDRRDRRQRGRRDHHEPAEFAAGHGNGGARRNGQRIGRYSRDGARGRQRADPGALTGAAALAAPSLPLVAAVLGAVTRSYRRLISSR